MKTQALGIMLRRWRNAAGLSRSNLAAKAGCSTESIRKYEAGTRTPRLEQLMSVCGALAESGASVSGDGPSSAQELALSALRTQMQV